VGDLHSWQALESQMVMTVGPGISHCRPQMILQHGSLSCPCPRYCCPWASPLINMDFPRYLGTIQWQTRKWNSWL
jgi:hypothetical protein